MGTRPRLRWAGFALFFAVLLTHASEARAQRPHWLGFRGDLGVEIPRGDPDDFFQGNVRGEFSLLVMPAAFYPVHLGAGFSWVSFPSESGNDEEQWNYVGSHFLIGLTLQKWIRLPLYFEGRVIERRLRPMDQRYWERDSDDVDTRTPFPQKCGITVEGVVGLELALTQAVFVDMAGRLSDFTPEPADFTADGLPNFGSGWTFGLQLGLLWFP